MSGRTFAISASAAGSRHLFQSERKKALLLDVLRHYRREKKYLLHAFVMMPTHIHLLITPSAEISLEKCIQLVKGNYSYRVKKELGINSDVWNPGFNPDRVKSTQEYAHKNYIHMNPVKAGLVAAPELYEYSSAWSGRRMDPNPFLARAKAHHS